MTSNSDMPAMPLTGNAYEDFAGYDGTKNTSYNPDCQGLTKLEHFAGLAPIMPPWFELEFLQNPKLNGGNNYLDVNGSVGSISLQGNIAMHIAWPVYYAKALLAELIR